jgi:hypothetical protein
MGILFMSKSTPKTYLAIAVGHGVMATGYVSDLFPGETRKPQRGERILGQRNTLDEAFELLLKPYETRECWFESCQSQSSIQMNIYSLNKYLGVSTWPPGHKNK